MSAKNISQSPNTFNKVDELMVYSGFYWPQGCKSNQTAVKLLVTVGGGTYMTFLELCKTHLTTETWAHSKGFAFFRNFLGEKRPIPSEITFR